MRTHLAVVGALYTAIGAMGVLIAAISAVAIAGGGLISRDSEAIAITSTVSVFVGLLLLIPAVPCLIGGIGLLRLDPWSRMLVLVLGCVSLLVIPFGTILGIYALWALTRPESVMLLSDNDLSPARPLEP